MSGKNSKDKSREEARDLAGQGYSASYISKNTDLSKEGSKNVVSNWGPAAQQSTQSTESTQPTNEPISFTPTSPTNWGQYGSEEIYKTIQAGQENLVNLQGQWAENAANIAANASVTSTGIRADADQEIARAYSDAQKYGSELGLEGVKYGADKESEWRQSVANIEVQGKLDLQPIINAGLESIAAIEAQASRDVAETTGKYSLESMKQRTATDENLGKIQLAGSMYGLINSVFG